MYEQLKMQQLLKELKQVFEEFPDERKGKNSQSEMTDAGMGAFSVFFIQCASFLEHQEELKRMKGRSNAESLFEMMNIPSDNQIRGLLDPVNPKWLTPMYRIIFQRVEQMGLLDAFRSHANSLLIAMDGTEYFSSQKTFVYLWCPLWLKGFRLRYSFSSIFSIAALSILRTASIISLRAARRCSIKPSGNKPLIASRISLRAFL